MLKIFYYKFWKFILRCCRYNNVPEARSNIFHTLNGLHVSIDQKPTYFPIFLKNATLPAIVHIKELCRLAFDMLWLRFRVMLSATRVWFCFDAHNIPNVNVTIALSNIRQYCHSEFCFLLVVDYALPSIPALPITLNITYFNM
jgi:hypothetical protein